MQVRQVAKRSRGYTLVEVLAVVVLMGLIATVFVPSLARASRSSQLQQLQSDLIQLDAQARQLAQFGSLVTIHWESEIRGVRLLKGQDKPQEVISLTIPDQFELTPVGFERAVVFDALGHTQSYGYRISSDTGSNQVEFNGLSGWHEAVYSDE